MTTALTPTEYRTRFLSGGHSYVEHAYRQPPPASWAQVPMLGLENRYRSTEDNGLVCQRSSLFEMLTAPFPTDAHYTQYVNPLGLRLRKRAHDDVPFEAHVMLFDIDRVGSTESESPTEYLKYLGFNTVLWSDSTPVPNFIYSGRGGVHFGVILERPICDRTEFERKYRRLWKRYEREICSQNHAPYFLDPGTKDWTRLFRARFVVRTDKPYDYSRSLLWVCHDRRLDPEKMAVEREKKPKIPKGAQVVTGDASAFLRKHTRTLWPDGDRRNPLNKHVFTLYVFYDEPEADRAAQVLADHARASGMDEMKVETTLRSARADGLRKREMGNE